MNISRSLGLMVSVLALVAGCATEPSQDPLNGVQAGRVRFLHEPPADAKFIAKVVYSSGDYDNWQSNCVAYLAAKAVKLGGNVVVPGVELDLGPHQLYGDHLSGAQPPAFVVRDQARDPYGYPQAPMVSVMPARFHFWSSVYACPPAKP